MLKSYRCTESETINSLISATEGWSQHGIQTCIKVFFNMWPMLNQKGVQFQAPVIAPQNIAYMKITSFFIFLHKIISILWYFHIFLQMWTGGLLLRHMSTEVCCSQLSSWLELVSTSKISGKSSWNTSCSSHLPWHMRFLVN